MTETRPIAGLSSYGVFGTAVPSCSGCMRGMNSSIDRILATYDAKELAVLADFLRRTSDAGVQANEELGG